MEDENKRLNDMLITHQDNIRELYKLSPESGMHHAEIVRFFLQYPGLIGISYASAEILMREKNLFIMTAAIAEISEQLIKRRDVNAPGYCFVRRNVSTNQVREILSNIRRKKPDQPPDDFKKTGKNARSEVVSFRATSEEEDAIGYLASACGVSKSFLIDVLITISNKYGIIMKR